MLDIDLSFRREHFSDIDSRCFASFRRGSRGNRP